jgi:Flp pilus assembly protein TadG
MRNRSAVAQFTACQSGNIAVVSAITVSAAVGIAGLAILYFQGVEQKTSIQAGLDAGVLAGTALPYSASDKERIAAAEAAFYANSSGGVFAATSTSADFEADTTPRPVFSVAKTGVTGVAVARVKNGLSVVLGVDDIGVKAVAKAAKRMSVPVCVLAMNSSNENSIYAYGNARLKADNCAIQANSVDDAGLSIQGTKSSISAAMIGATGSFKGGNFTPQPITKVEPVADPYASLAFPEAGPCIDAASKLSKMTATLAPGTYCGGLEIKAGATVELDPGIYVIKDGPFKVNSGARVTGDKVLIALAGKNSVISLQSDSYVKLSSPSSGTYRNIQFMSDRDLSQSKFEEEWSTVLSGAVLEYDGVAYLPEQSFWVSGTAHEAVVRATSPSMILQADTV